jgi:hypothetical protein
MKLEGNAYPFKESKGGVLPDVQHAGLTKIEHLFITALHGALASGKDVLESLMMAQDVLDNYESPAVKPEPPKWKK